MKTMILKNQALIETSPLEYNELPEPIAEEKQILIRVRACGVCHTDLHEVEGDLPLIKKPVIIGHQVVGVVDRVGKDVTKFKRGERVGIPWVHRTCGICHFCRSSSENLCESARFTGYSVDGGYAEFMVSEEGFTYQIPENFSDEEATPLLCAGIIGYRSIRLSDLQKGERLGLFGFGASAHIALQIARHHGCEVFVFTRSEEHQKLAAELGAAWAGRADEHPPAKLDRAITFAPAGQVVLAALGHLRKGGTLAINAIYLDRVPEMDYEKHLYYEKTIRSVASSTRQDAVEFLELAGEIPIKTEVKVFPLKEANRALQLLKESRITGAATLKIS
ncbi:MAG: zinc-dependent alcohol dehydrogenase family protein [Acidobacteriota bacterium]